MRQARVHLIRNPVFQASIVQNNINVTMCSTSVCGIRSATGGLKKRKTFWKIVVCGLSRQKRSKVNYTFAIAFFFT